MGNGLQGTRKLKDHFKGVTEKDHRRGIFISIWNHALFSCRALKKWGRGSSRESSLSRKKKYSQRHFWHGMSVSLFGAIDVQPLGCTLLKLDWSFHVLWVYKISHTHKCMHVFLPKTSLTVCQVMAKADFTSLIILYTHTHTHVIYVLQGTHL